MYFQQAEHLSGISQANHVLVPVTLSAVPFMMHSQYSSTSTWGWGVNAWPQQNLTSCLNMVLCGCPITVMSFCNSPEHEGGECVMVFLGTPYLLPHVIYQALDNQSDGWWGMVVF